ncbi:MAG: hypothetical protein H5U40_09080 [Polyangiaceae bacterium]|nr:hypothetical protein [Polyangiaceae bacterium]
MSWQSVATALVIAAAVAYLVYKVFIASRPARRKDGPDVPIGRLMRGKRRPPSCHE